MDGVFIQSGNLLPGALETVNILKAKNIPFRFLTNTTTKSKKTLHKQLNRLGIKCEEKHIFSAGFAGIRTIIDMGGPSCKLYISDDLKEDYKVFNLNNSSPELIVIGDYKKWDTNLLNQAFNYVMAGANILALHVGKYYKTDTGFKLDAGAFVKAIEYSTGKKAIVVGKPNTLFFQEALHDLKLTQNDVLMIGDDLYNDIYGAQRLNIKGILVKTGKYSPENIQDYTTTPDGIIDSIGEIAKILESPF